MTREELIEQTCLIHTLTDNATTCAFLDQFYDKQRDDWWAAIMAVADREMLRRAWPK